ncbi:head GIN domain-containing protein [Chloroflexota bacterium]
MKKLIATVMVVLILISGLMVSCAGVKVLGSGNVINETFDLGDFTGIKAQNGFQVEVTKSDSFSVVAIVDDNVLEHIEIRKSGDTLIIRPKSNRSFRSVTLSAKVTMPDIDKVELSGGAKVEINGFDSSNNLPIKLSGGSHLNGSVTAGDVNLSLSGGSHVNLSGSANELIANGSGGSHISLSGSAENIVIKGSGGSHFNLQDYSVSDADINLSGGSHASVNVNGTLNVDISGDSEVIYTGEPTFGKQDVAWDSDLTKK